MSDGLFISALQFPLTSRPHSNS